MNTEATWMGYPTIQVVQIRLLKTLLCRWFFYKLKEASYVNLRLSSVSPYFFEKLYL